MTISRRGFLGAATAVPLAGLWPSAIRAEIHKFRYNLR